MVNDIDSKMKAGLAKSIMQQAAETFTSDELMTLQMKSQRWIGGISSGLPKWLTKFCNRWIPQKTTYVMPPFVGTIIRVSGKGISLPDNLRIDVGGSDIGVLKFIDIVSIAASILLKNEKNNPTKFEQQHIENELTFFDLHKITYAALSFSELTAISAAYGLKKEKTTTCHAEDTGKLKEAPVLAESLPHYNIGSALKYFKGSMTENDIKWSLTWSNYMLYIATIPDSPEAEEKKPIEVKDSDDIF